LCFVGNSGGQLPSGMSGTGPFAGPPASSRFRSPSGLGLGEGDGLLGDGLLGEAVLGEGLLGDGLLGNGLLVALEP
jgi:hypothetical protein